jgi:hypothetical protein
MSSDLFADFEAPPAVGPHDSPAARAAAARLPYQQHSDTSRAAAAAAAGGAATDRRRVLEFLRARGDQGATDEEIQARLAMHPNGHRARRIELVERGLARDSGRKRATARNHPATVWVAVEGEG